MPRILVIGCSGSGKTTFARAIESGSVCTRLELDALYHQSEWTPLETGLFRKRVVDFMDQNDDWVIDGNYSAVQGLVLERASMVVWLDVSLLRATIQLGLRTLRRVVTRAELWNGNREGIQNLCSLNPDKSVLAWMFKTHRTFPGRFEKISSDPDLNAVDFRRITTGAEAEVVLSSIRGAAGLHDSGETDTKV